MKKTICSALAVTLVFFFFGALMPALADAASAPAHILKDSERNTTIPLYPTGDTNDHELLLYINERFGFSIKVPDTLLDEVVALPDNGDGIILQSKGGQFRFRVSGGFVMADDAMKTSLQDALESVKDAQALETVGDGWWRLVWRNGPDAGIRKFMSNGKVWAECEITGPSEVLDARNAYNERLILERVLESLTLH